MRWRTARGKSSGNRADLPHISGRTPVPSITLHLPRFDDEAIAILNANDIPLTYERHPEMLR